MVQNLCNKSTSWLVRVRVRVSCFLSMLREINKLRHSRFFKHRQQQVKERVLLLLLLLLLYFFMPSDL